MVPTSANRLNQQLNSISCTALNAEETSQLLNSSLQNQQLQQAMLAVQVGQQQQPTMNHMKPEYVDFGHSLNNNPAANMMHFQTLPSQPRSSFHQTHPQPPPTQHIHSHQQNNQLNNDLNLSFNLIENDIKEIRDYLRHTRKKLETTDAKVKQTNEWKQVALVLDRTLFFIYVIAIFVSFPLIIPR